MKWSREACFNEAKKYKTRNEFKTHNQSAYNAANRNKWTDEYTWFEKKKKPNGYWNYTTCYNEALNYKSRNEFQDKSSGAYHIAAKNGWLDDYSWLVNQNIIWNYDSCRAEAEKYKSKTDFMKNNRRAYTIAKKMRWLDDYTWLERRRISDKPIYTVYRYFDEETNSVYVGLTNNLNVRHKQHSLGKIYHGERRFDIVYNYFISIGKVVPEPNVLKRELYADEAQYYEDYYIAHYKRDGLNVLNTAKAGSLGGLGLWTKERCRNEAEKYRSKSEFEKGCGSAYKVARQNGWLSDYIWFDLKWEQKWTKDNCYAEAKKYKSRGEFKNKNNGAYSSALKNNWLDDYTWFLPTSSAKKWTYETCYDEAMRFKSKTEFRKNSSSAYNIASRNKWLGDYIWLEEKKKPNGYWNRESCYNEAKRYNSRGKFCDGSPTAYAIAKKKGWIEEYSWFSRPKNYNKKWTRETCFREAQKYKKRSEFKKLCSGAYAVARKNGWLDDYTWFKAK